MGVDDCAGAGVVASVTGAVGAAVAVGAVEGTVQPISVAASKRAAASMPINFFEFKVFNLLLLLLFSLSLYGTHTSKKFYITYEANKVRCCFLSLALGRK